MNHKIQLSLVLVAVIAVAIWFYGNDSNSLSGKNASTSSNPAPEVTGNQIVLQNRIYTYEVDGFPDGLVIDEDAINEALKETVATYTNSEGQRIEIVVTSGAKGADIAPAN